MGIISLITLNEKESHLHCGKNSLTGSFGWFLQTLLASLAFTCLILKRWCEPSSERRPWKIWWYDTSKQGLGALVIHMINIVLSENFDGDPCTWYIINFLLDSSIGLFMVYIGIRAAQYLADIKHWESIRFGEYGKPPSANAWIIQCVLYVLLMMFVKLVITLIMRFKFWEQVREFVLSPIPNPLMELILVILIIPLVVNVSTNIILALSEYYSSCILDYIYLSNDKTNNN
ncbi:hypothetical protein AAG570_008248 [Ranatra chinensis]|uniref:Uncharacterized protein n=1 Tax=Ranatra chinensis TaxID=642074 RepID=A0ABD0XSL4_9HEMI